MSVAEGEQSRPPDDSGAPTADRYHWQAAMAAVDGFKMLLDSLDEDAGSGSHRIICEWDEDWEVHRPAELELVSAKHRELDRGAYTTVGSLVGEGGLGHLFCSWMRHGGAASARLVTSGGIGGTTAVSAGDLRDACNALRVDSACATSSVEDAIQKLCEGLRGAGPHLPNHWVPADGVAASAVAIDDRHRADVRRFMNSLTMEQRPSRADTPDLAPSRYVRPLLERLGLVSTVADAVWNAVLGLFTERMRARGPVLNGGLGATGAQPAAQQLARDLASRTVTVGDLRTTVLLAAGSPAAFASLPQPTRTDTLSLKMDAGGCLGTSIERASGLRRRYRRYVDERKSNIGFVSEIEDLEAQIHRFADRMQQEVPEQPGWGATVWALMNQALEDDAAVVPSGIDGELLLGGVCELARRCEIWFTPQAFDIKARRRELAGGPS
jgi:hypothetical protein